MKKVSAVLVIALGVVLANRGLALSGFSIPSVPFGAGSGTQGSSVATVRDGIQIITTKLSSGSYEPITVQKGIPVKWTIQAQKGDINGCNNEIVIPKFKKSQKLKPGDNVIEFTPTEAGTFAYSCWMGMIRSKITVVEDINSVDTTGADGGVQKSDYRIPTDEIAVAQIKDGEQIAEINMEENRFSPAVVVMQRGIRTIWNIKGVKINDSNSTLIFPAYNTQINMQEGANEIYFIPYDDFDFSTADYTFYGYVKVVDDINEIDMDAIKNEIEQYVPAIRELIDNSGLPSCH